MSYPITIDSAGGEYMETVVVVEWAVALGDAVKAGDVVVTVETAKAATEIEAAHDGFLTDILYPVGSEAPVGAVLGRIGDSKEAVSKPAEAAAGDAVASDEDWAEPKPAPRAGARVVASPLARRLAKAAGIDLAAVRGSGPRGRIKQRDIEAAIAAGGTAMKDAAPRAAAVAGTQATSAPPAAVDLPPVVLLHGFGADRFAWRWVAPLLDCANRTVTLELPGHGGQAGDPARSVDDMAFALSDQLEALGIARAHLVGHSLGGAVALKLTQLGRVEVLSLGLVAPAGLGPEINGAFLRGLLDATGPDNLMPWLRLMVNNPAALPNGFGAAVMRQRNSAPALRRKPKSPGGFANGSQSFDLRDALQSVKVPTRVVWGRQDAIIPASHAAAVPGTAGLHLLDGIGHTAPMECPDLLARIIVELVRSVG